MQPFVPTGSIPAFRFGFWVRLVCGCIMLYVKRSELQLPVSLEVQAFNGAQLSKLCLKLHPFLGSARADSSLGLLFC